MNKMAAEPLHAAETISALQALEKREMIFKRHTAVFTNTQTYYFKHAMLREVTYEGVLLRDRPAFHKQVADWLSEQSGERIAEYAGLIAEHYELAGQNPQSAELYEIAATRAQNMANPEGAIEYFGKALALLTEQAHDTAWQVRLQRRLGALLQMRARLVEAAQTYMTMRYTAQIDGDLAAQAHAWNGLASIHQNQTDFAAMLEDAMQAEQVAWLVSAEAELARALLFKSEAHLCLGDTELASAAANRALTISEGEHDTKSIMLSLSQLCAIYIESGRHNRARFYLEELADQLDAPNLEAELIALNRAAQGRLLAQLEQYDEAVHELLAALNLFRELDHQPKIAATLNQLGELAHWRGNSAAAIPLYREALSIAEAIGDSYASLFYHTNLGGAFVDVGEAESAQAVLQQVIDLAQDVSRVVHWIGLPKMYRFRAGAYLQQSELDAALTAVQAAMALSSGVGQGKSLGASWRLLGQIVAQLPPEKRPFMIEDQPYDAPACFAASLRHLREKEMGAPTQREQVLTLWAWGAYALDHEDVAGGQKMQAEARTIAAPLGIELPHS